ncbi:MAG TPA: DUF2079 domain-containing protein [Candidatus Rubrimentiphilum sp.]|nr:DUF2079 domain-containing protein [Candidatus Rubrimentiphilum sp.]
MGRTVSRTEFFAAIAIFAIVFTMCTAYKLIRSDQWFGDSAVYFQATENLASRGAPVSQVKASVNDYMDSGSFQSTPTAAIAANPSSLFGRSTPATEVNVLRGHAYFVLFPIALLVKLLPVQVVLLSLYAFSFSGMILLAYFMLRIKGVSIISACLFCLLVASQPAWWQGLLLGQFYPDRLFLLAGFAFMAFVALTTVQNGKLTNRVWLAVMALLCASINERGALVAGVFMLFYVALYWKKPGLDRYYKLALSAGLLGYSYVAIKFIVPTDTSYSTFLPTSLDGLLNVVHLPQFIPLVALFLLVNAPLLSLSFFEWRTAAIAVFLMLPNIFGNIGGAEKVGWSTHYPSYYFPSLVLAALMGYAALHHQAAAKRRLPALYALTAAFMVYIAVLNPYSYSPISLALSNAADSFFPTAAADANQFLFQSEPRRNLEAAVNGIRQAVPPHSVVSSVEGGMPLLYQDRTIEFFPEDLDHADYAVLGAHYINGKISYFGSVSYLGADEQAKLSDLVQARMIADGYDVDHPKMFPGFKGLAVVRRVH